MTVLSVQFHPLLIDDIQINPYNIREHKPLSKVRNIVLSLPQLSLNQSRMDPLDTMKY